MRGGSDGGSLEFWLPIDPILECRGFVQWHLSTALQSYVLDI